LEDSILSFSFTGKYVVGCFFLPKWQTEDLDYKIFIVIQVIVPHIYINSTYFLSIKIANKQNKHIYNEL